MTARVIALPHAISTIRNVKHLSFDAPMRVGGGCFVFTGGRDGHRDKPVRDMRGFPQ